MMLPADARLVERFRLFLKEGLACPDLTLADAAEACATSPRVLQRKLDALYGSGFAQLPTAAQMRRAAGMLRDGHSATDTCRACGYRNPSSFFRQFRECRGSSPTEFARRPVL